MKRTALLCLTAGILAAASAATNYHLLKKVAVPGNGGWDYLSVDADAHRLYVAHASQVEVLDTESAAPVATIPNTKGVHGIAIAHDLNRGFTSNGGSDTVTIFDLKTLKPISDVKTGKGPDSIVYDPGTQQVFAYNGEGNSATVINAKSGQLAGTIDLGGGPEFSASDNKGHVFVNLEDKNMVLRLDAHALKVMDRWPLAPCEAPSALAMDLKTNRLFAGCRNHMMAVIDASNGKVVAHYTIGDHVDAASWDPEAKLVFLSCGDGTLSVFHQDSADQYSLAQTVTTQQGAKTHALDLKTHKVYLSTAEYGPAPQGGGARARRPVLPGTFSVLVFGP